MSNVNESEHLLTRNPFQSLRADGRSQADLVYEVFKDRQFGDVVTYEEIQVRTDLDVRTNRTPIYGAIRRLEDNDQRTAENVPKVGYRIVEPVEHGRLALKHHKRSRRQLRQAHRKVRSADRTQMTATEAQRLNDLEIVVSRHEQMLGRISKQVSGIKTALDQTRQEQTEKHGELSDQLTRLQSALKRRFGEDFDLHQ